MSKVHTPTSIAGNKIERAAVKISRYYFAALSIFAVFILIYRDVSIFSGSMLEILAYLVSFILVICIFLPSDIRIGFSLLTFIVLAFLVGANVYLAASANNDWARKFRALTAGVDFDARSKHEVIMDFRRGGVDAVPQIAQTESSSQGLYPLGGISRKLTVLCNELGFFATYHSDRYGFNNPDEVYDNVVPGKSNVVLGDSFAHGACVHEGQDVASAFRHRGWNSLNLAISGNGPLHALASWIEYGQDRKPDYVLWMFYEGNDLENIISEMVTPLKKYLDQGFTQDLQAQQDEISQILSAKLKIAYERLRLRPEENVSIMFFNQLLTLYHVRKLLGLTRDRSRINEILATLPTFEQVARRLQANVEATGAKLIFVYLPSFTTITAGGFRSAPPKTGADLKSNVRDIIGRAGISFLDFEKVILSLPDPLAVFPLRIFGHLNAHGYDLLANWIDEKLAIEN